ncbi:uncharacterized protein TRIVIDRAFT_47246 [Trichoderma virens Gv29-8]|uniref:2EXR domain-containing protein n=1 Tax=Hypocrea virens (strain Gv29-8 / FGSC 10586) TaxID=413071 RepID=G9N3Y1_HYPVG|nr:uncharacterized protein TRIVIDRAFT_47246 [Trichoderma virens Gv29-8]EHK18310.1 hypothetical protein TRIVIDRAFT_47246 [Trichoderma virens Gv29-8]
MQSRVRQFMDLPLELRLMVWKFALRPLDPARPGAHFFSVVNTGEDGDKAARISVRCKGRNRYCSRYHLAAPKLDSEEGSPSWTRKNPSAYIWDFGLWSACRESRHVIKAHYEKIICTKKFRNDSTITLSFANTSISLSFRHSKERWRFFFHPDQDLVCLQAFDPSTIYWWEDRACGRVCITNTAAKLFNTINYFDRPSLLRLGNVAIAYDPSWNDIEKERDKYSFRGLYEEQSARGFFIRTLALIELNAQVHFKSPTFWLIDYNINRIRFPKNTRKGRKVFYGNGQTFAEVDKSSSRRSFSSGEYSSALEFLDNLDILLGGDNPSHSMIHESGRASCYICSNPFHGTRPYQIHRHVRVLMCEKGST